MSFLSRVASGQGLQLTQTVQNVQGLFLAAFTRNKATEGAIARKCATASQNPERETPRFQREGLGAEVPRRPPGAWGSVCRALARRRCFYLRRLGYTE